MTKIKPDFIIAGIMKSGTTYLDNLVSSHPQINMLNRSMEYSFFDNDEVYENGIDWYFSLFDELNNKKVVGQTSADIAFNPGSIVRIKKHIPNAKLIFIIRKPIERMYSLYWHQVSMGREYLTFEKALEKESSRIKKNYYNLKMYSYKSRSRYKEQFDKVKSIIDEDDILILPFEDFIKNEKFFLNQVFEFIGVEKVESLNEIKTLKTKTNSAMIPPNLMVVWVSYMLQSIGLIRVGRYFLNKMRKPVKIPPIRKETYEVLEKELEEDILFYNEVNHFWEKRMDNA